MADEDMWRMAFIDCLSPVFRKRAHIISRDLRTDLEDVLSDMFEAALVAWMDTERGCPPGSVRHKVVKGAYEIAYKRAKVCGGEWSSDCMDGVPIFPGNENEFTIKTSGVVDSVDVRDPVVAEQIRGERFGALLRKMNCVDRMTLFHQEIRDGLHPGIADRVMKGGVAERVWVDGAERYYYVSDFYPKFMRLPAAAEVMGVAESAAYRKVRGGDFPFPVNSTGRSYQVSVGALMHHVGISDAVVHMDDVENGAGYAG